MVNVKIGFIHEVESVTEILTGLISDLLELSKMSWKWHILNIKFQKHVKSLLS